MPKYKVAMEVDGMIYLDIEAENKEQAATKASNCVPEGDYMQIIEVRENDDA